MYGPEGLGLVIGGAFQEAAVIPSLLPKSIVKTSGSIFHVFLCSCVG